MISTDGIVLHNLSFKTLSIVQIIHNPTFGLLPEFSGKSSVGISFYFCNSRTETVFPVVSPVIHRIKIDTVLITQFKIEVCTNTFSFSFYIILTDIHFFHVDVSVFLNPNTFNVIGTVIVIVIRSVQNKTNFSVCKSVSVHE